MDARQSEILGMAEFCFKQDIENKPRRVVMKKVNGKDDTKTYVVVVETVPVDTCRDALGFVNPIQQQVIAVEKKFYNAKKIYEKTIDEVSK